MYTSYPIKGASINLHSFIMCTTLEWYDTYVFQYIYLLYLSVYFLQMVIPTSVQLSPRGWRRARAAVQWPTQYWSLKRWLQTEVSKWLYNAILTSSSFFSPVFWKHEWNIIHGNIKVIWWYFDLIWSSI